MSRSVTWLVCAIVLNSVVAQNCRNDGKESRECESLCDSDGKCVVKAALLLPKSTTYDASLSSVSIQGLRKFGKLPNLIKNYTYIF